MVGLLGGLGLSVLLPMALATPAKAAERVTLTYGFVEISTTVEALQQYADTGVADRELDSYLNYLNSQQRSQLRQSLQRRQDIDPVQMSQFLYSAIGDNVLRSFGTVIRTEGRRDGAKGLRGALVLAAADPEGLSLLGVLDKFPTGSVRIDAQQGFRIFNAFTGLLQDTDRALNAIRAQSVPTALIATEIPTLSALSESGPYTVETQELSLVDRQRNRTLPTDLYLPVDAPPAPVVIISHGLAGDRKGFSTVSQHLASHGYAVVALDHPGSNTTRLFDLLQGIEQEVSDPREFSDRPKDVTFLLDDLTRMNESGALANRLDLSKVGIIGHSFGGYTALALSGARLDYDNLQANCDSDAFIFNAANPSMILQCTALLDSGQFTEDLRDERIQAVIALNPVTSSLFGREGFSQIEVPSLLIAGSADPVAPALLEQIQPFTWLNAGDQTAVPDHYLALIQGGTHLYDPIDIDGADSIALSSQLVNADTELAYSYLRALTLGFMEAEINQNTAYKAALDDTSIVQLGTQPLPLYIVSTLTEEMLKPPETVPPATTEDSPQTAPPIPVEESAQ
ncbi:MAG: alpha/beta fold hydrolase [Cyanobacteria bacterium J06560_6]